MSLKKLLKACKGNLEMVKLLLKHKANPNDTDKYGNTALMWGIKFGNLNIYFFSS